MIGTLEEDGKKKMAKEYIHIGDREREGRKVDRAENMEIRRQGSHGIQTATRVIYVYIYIYYTYLWLLSLRRPIISSRDCSSITETGLTSIYF